MPNNAESTDKRSKVHSRTGHEELEVEQTYSSTLSLTSAIDEGGWSAPRNRQPYYQEKDTVPIL
jgi:hypothetical protein